MAIPVKIKHRLVRTCGTLKQRRIRFRPVLNLSVLLCLVASTSELAFSQTVRIAIAQTVCIDGDRPGNLVRIDNALASAKAKGAQIVCFPEMSILGWVNPDAHRQAFPIPGNDSVQLCKFAKKHKVFVSIGLAEKEGQKLYDSAILINDRGQILLKHRKINVLSGLMDPPYSRGEATAVVNTRFGRIGILICADTFDQKVLGEMAVEKPQLLLVPYGWAAKVDTWPTHGLSLRETVKNASKTINCTLVGPT